MERTKGGSTKTVAISRTQGPCPGPAGVKSKLFVTAVSHKKDPVIPVHGAWVAEGKPASLKEEGPGNHAGSGGGPTSLCILTGTPHVKLPRRMEEGVELPECLSCQTFTPGNTNGSQLNISKKKIPIRIALLWHWRCSLVSNNSDVSSDLSRHQTFRNRHSLNSASGERPCLPGGQMRLHNKVGLASGFSRALWLSTKKAWHTLPCLGLFLRLLHLKVSRIVNA